MNSSNRSADRIAVIGLVVGAVFGIAGTFVADASLRQLLWTLDGVGLVVAAVLLAVKYFREGRDVVAAGFLVFAIGEGLLVSGNSAGLTAGAPSFGGGAALWAAGLFLISIPTVFPVWVRVVGVIAGILFAVVAAQIAWGLKVVATTAPLPFDAYPVLVLTFIGWIVTVIRRRPGPP